MDIKTITKELNSARIKADNKQFKTVAELGDFLRNFQVPHNSNFTNKVSHLLDCDRRFTSSPIHISVVEKIYNETKELQKKYYCVKKEKNQQSSLQDRIQEAICLLKENGYKVLAQVTEFREI